MPNFETFFEVRVDGLSQLEKMAMILEVLSQRMREFTSSFNMNHQKMLQFDNVIDTTAKDLGTGKSKGLNLNLDKFGAALKGIVPQILGVMFFAMGLNAVFKSLLQPVAEVFGLFELWNIVLITLFLPVMELMFPYLLDIMMWFIDLPENVKLVTGVFVALGLVFTSLLVPLSALVIVISGLAAIFGGAAVASAIVAIGVALSWVAVVAAAFWLLWKTDLGGFRDFVKTTFGVVVDTIKIAWKGIEKIFSGIIDFITGVFSGDFDKALGGLWKIVEGAVLLIIAPVFGFATLLYNAFAWAVNSIKQLFINTFVTSILWALEKVTGWLSKLPGDIGETFKTVEESIKGAKEAVQEFANKPIMGYMTLEKLKQELGLLPKPVNLGYSIAPSTGDYLSDLNQLQQPKSSIIQNNTYNVTVSDRSEWIKDIEQNNKDNVDWVKRTISGA
jgi:hypothetical protein